MKKKRIILGLFGLSLAGLMLASCAKKDESGNTITTSADVTTPTTDTPVTGDTTVTPSTDTTVTPSTDTTVTPTDTQTTDVVEEYTVTFDSNGGTSVVAKKVEKDGKVEQPTNPTKAGCEFDCWTLDGQKFDFNTPISKSITLVAKWVAKDAQAVNIGFGGDLTPWTKLEEVAGTKLDSSNRNVLAGSASLNGFTFASNGKNRVDDGTVYNSQKADITINMKTAGTLYVEGTWGSTTTSGTVFVTNSGGTKVYTSSKYTAPADLKDAPDISFSKELAAGVYVFNSDATLKITKLYVSRVVENVTVSFASEYGSKPVDAIVEKGDKLTSLPTISADGYVFQGWYNGDTLFDLDTPISADLTLTAKWKVYDENDYATVKFNTGVSTAEVNDVIIEKGKTLTSLPDLGTVEGYRFDGWYTDSSFNNKFVSSSAINETMTLYARFVKQYDVTFQYDASDIISTIKVDEGETITSIPNAKTIYGKKFIGWFNGDTEFNFTDGVTGKLTLVAKYEEITVTTSIAVMSSSAYQEGLYAEFMPYEGATSYNAYVKKETDSVYTKIDSQLIRTYKTTDGKNQYLRVDAVGLKAGTYMLKIAPQFGTEEAEAAAVVLARLVVEAHDRSGFGFVNGISSGAYNEDGTLKSGVKVLYVTNDNKDTISYTTVNKDGKEATPVGIQNIITNLKNNKKAEPVCVRFLGNILDPANMPKGDLYLDDVHNCTFEGIGNDATMNGFGIVVKGSSNIEIRNLGFMNCNSSEGDDCGLQQDNNHIWVHNCDFFYGDAGSDSDQAKGDGALDTKKSSYVTHSYNHFFDNGKCNLQGMTSETAQNYITYHHNWYDHSDSRHPRVRTCTVHVYNNYFDGNSKYGIGSALGASIFAENNYFRSTSNTIPFMTGYMGHDVKDAGGYVLSGEKGGLIKAYGNVLDGNNFRFTPYTAGSTNYDAYVASSRDEVVPTSVFTPSGTPYNNFDTNSSIMYQYTVQSAEEARATVIQKAGRVQGGDFKWTFTDADDADYDVNTALKAAIVAYKSNLVSVQGIDSSSSGSGSGTDTPTPVEVTAADVDALIEALPESTAITENDRTSVLAANAAYEGLSTDEKAKVKTENVTKLEACVAALPEVTSFTADFTKVTVSGTDVTLYNENNLLVTATKTADNDTSRGIKFNSKYGFTVKNTSSNARSLVITVVGNGNNKSFTYGTKTVTFGTTAVTVDISLAAGESVTFVTSTGGAYLKTIVVS